MRVSQVFTMGGGGCGHDDCHSGCHSDCHSDCYDGCYSGCTRYGYYYNGYRNDNFSGFERGSTRRGLLGILGG